MMMSNHFFHLVNFSPWPILMAFNLINVGSSIIIMILNKELIPVSIAVILVLMIKFQWWRDVVREALYEGAHSKMVKQGISMGVLSFIISELCFFVSFFWMYFYLSLSPDMVMGMVWPPAGITSVNFLDIPLLNTLILLASGFFITWSHYSLMKSSDSEMKISYVTAILLGIYFFIIQMYEYYELSFDLSDSAFGSSFFILTGFHGFHVVVGILFLSVNFKRLINNNFSMMYPMGFEYSIWYWHFVDVVWLFLYLFLYWWGM
uniref:Cytochrome c oxidase subunit 3 n=1 Tax=Pealius mori TaxID=1453199 RepID=A0A7G2CUY9_9HEMI|nr:cytochrome c oxidase subunit III [Pealius mori]WPM91804.1 cytochrome c oxidase subunit III [Pealius mori]CAD5105721.1 cytochrome c oxidase subunit 3 [Pealius mori]